MDMELSLAELALKARLPAKKILAWESAGHIAPRFRTKGHRHVRCFSPDLVALVVRVAGLVRDGYRLQAAFQIARREAAEFEKPTTTSQ